MQLVTLPNVKRVGLRCERCADAADLNPPAAVVVPPLRKLELTGVGEVAKDWTARKMGEAE